MPTAPLKLKCVSLVVTKGPTIFLSGEGRGCDWAFGEIFDLFYELIFNAQYN